MKRAIKMDLDATLNEMKMNLSNNYKDLAHVALKELHSKLESYYMEGAIKEKDYCKYKKIADEYSVRLKDYHH